MEGLKLAWTLFAVGSIADGWTFAQVSAPVVAAQETSPLAHALGSGLGTSIVCKTFALAMALLFVYLGKRGKTEWLTPWLIGGFGVLCLVGAWTNIAFGWS